MVAHPSAVSVPRLYRNDERCQHKSRGNGAHVCWFNYPLDPPPPCITCIMETTDWVQQLLLYEANSFPLQTLFIKCPLCTQWKLSELCAHHMNWAGLADGWNFYPLLLFAVWVMELITSNCDGWINFRVDIRLRTCNAVKASVASICFHSAPVFPLGLAAESFGKNSKNQYQDLGFTHECSWQLVYWLWFLCSGSNWRQSWEETWLMPNSTATDHYLCFQLIA